MRVNLAAVREKRKLTHSDVARLVGISRAHYTHIENGTRDPSWDLARKLEVLFRRSASWLLQKHDDTRGASSSKAV